MKIYTNNRTLWRSIGMYCHRGVSYSTDNSLQFFILPVWFLCSKGKARSPINPKRELPELLFPFSNKRKWVPAKDVQDSHFANGAVKLIRRECRAASLPYFQAVTTLCSTAVLHWEGECYMQQAPQSMHISEKHPPFLMLEGSPLPSLSLLDSHFRTEIELASLAAAICCFQLWPLWLSQKSSSEMVNNFCSTTS